ncbi:hypothetical protein [Paenibacillus sp. YYML68]|uniref:hypothetical protein n=1 Tax=Paenibacillus sp. YYML68 TaxID=2909250 RepID=UPI0024931978|nr:hypothetical protein [Paenibacillus sp. YYML68]
MLNMPNPNAAAPQTIFEMEKSDVDVLSKCKHKVHDICSQHMHKPVRIQTVQGSMHDGIIVHIDMQYVYLQVMPGHSRAFLGSPYGYGYGAPGYNPYYNNVILPLALFDLLAIALLV